MSKLARTLTLVAVVAVMNLAAMAAVAQAQATDPRVEKASPQRLAAAQQQAPGEATARRLLARERSSIPNAGPAQATSPMRPTPHHDQAGRLTPALAGLAMVLALAAGIAALATRRAHRASQTA
jgi:hypothetical protein